MRRPAEMAREIPFYKTKIVLRTMLLSVIAVTIFIIVASLCAYNSAF